MKDFWIAVSAASLLVIAIEVSHLVTVVQQVTKPACVAHPVPKAKGMV